MAIPAINVLGNPNVTEGNFQIAIEDLRKSVIGSGKEYDAANTYSQYDTCIYGGVFYYSKINSNTGNTPTVNANWGNLADFKIITMDNILQSTTAVIGYTEGSGASVTQLTNKNTTVYCNSPTGTIITSNSLLSAGDTAQFSVICNYVTEHSTVQINCKYASGIGINYDVNAISNNGDFLVQLKNKDTVTRTDNVYITYTILKGTLI